jgi:hypothetical protein
MTPQQLREAYEALPPLRPVRQRHESDAAQTAPLCLTPQQLMEAYHALPDLHPVGRRQHPHPATPAPIPGRCLSLLSGTHD